MLNGTFILLPEGEDREDLCAIYTREKNQQQQQRDRIQLIDEMRNLIGEAGAKEYKRGGGGARQEEHINNIGK